MNSKKNLGNDYDFSFALTGSKALEKLKESKYDMVLISVGLSDMRGVDVYKKLRRNEHTGRIPVSFIAEEENREEIIEGIRKKLVGCISKPLETDRFNETVRDMLG